ncbi:alpha/beta hydrolase [Marinobacter sp. X15-166B]|uniref:alpha/beta hydrolase n=1 Tax=Marinobacter sp. X15-166B TaxID=1897620 RepID=UPI00085C228F|nr:alpha/beta hydrolase [Marinobacter sp. X15-166B]OEY66122.1 hypothetical protein BG841_06380 [Marinobacter sp. X15-166B]
MNRQDIEFKVDTGVIRGWFYLPDETRETVPSPCIVMAHGYAATKDMGLDRFARSFAGAGFAVLVFDYQGLGASTGLTRQHIDPFRQVDDYRHAITYATSRPEVDRNRIGVWGTSYSGGHVLMLAATDKRVKCVVSQVPTISGSKAFKRRMTPDSAQVLEAAFAQERLDLLDGKPATMRTLVSTQAADNPVYSHPDAVAWYLDQGKQSPTWVNGVTLQSMELFRAYEPGCYIGEISPAPLLIVVAENDQITPTDLALEAYEAAGLPKKLVTIPGGHFTPYDESFPEASKAACAWFTEHL